jgi:DNA primase small subunit
VIVEVLFRNFYRNRARLEVDAIERRELAFQLFSGAVIRHKAFRGIEELGKYVVERTPRHVYFSSAYYERPDESDMERKGWLGADLVFDIDGDHLETEACRGGELVTLECLDDARREALKLVDILEEELGVSPSRIAFSGHRGFHIYVSEREVLSLGQRERRELVNYLRAVGLDLSKFVVGPGRGSRKRGAPLYELEDAGNLKRLRRGLEDPRALRVEIDEKVTQDVHRLMRVPGSLNGKTGLVALPLSRGDLERGVESVVERAIAFRKGYLKLRLEKPLRAAVLFERVEAGRGDVRVLPAHVSVYLELQEYGKICD